MNHSEERLSKAFRHLAATTPQNAPPELGVALKESFRKHHIRRRRIRLAMSTAMAAACLTLSAVVWLSVSSLPARQGILAGAITQEGNQISLKPENKINNGPRNVPPQQQVKYTPKPGVKHRREKVFVASDFMPLPTHDPAVPVDAFQIVRVGLPDTALSQLGIPVRETASGQRIVADLLLDRDGMPLAVRFVGRQK